MAKPSGLNKLLADLRADRDDLDRIIDRIEAQQAQKKPTTVKVRKPQPRFVVTEPS
jgi:hypothetical protein